MPINYNDIRELKNRIRDESKLFRENLSVDKKLRLDQKIANKLLNLWYFRERELILTYVSNQIEIDTSFIINKSLEQGKKVAVPRCINGTSNMDFYIIETFEELSAGSFGILEPADCIGKKVLDYESGLCIVPALSFDENGFRLGFGKGYYDRFLSNVNVNTVGLCYDDCIYEKLPHGRYDKKVDMIVTESRIIEI